MKRKVYVKPVTAGGLFGWVTLELTPWGSFRDDWRRYGLVTAICNVWVTVVGHQGGG